MSASEKPRYQQVKDLIINRISSGDLGPSDRVPSENELVESMSVLALKKTAKERRVSLLSVEETRGITGYVAVGCAECHTANPDAHEDTFLHNGYRVHVVVTPADCAQCHPVEAKQYRTQNE